MIGIDSLGPGNVIADRYELVRSIGRGGSSVVWVAEHVATRKRVALKVLRKQGVEDQARFLREARVATRVVHPNVVAIHDVFQLDDDSALVMVMDLLEGKSLAQRLEAEGSLTVRETATIVLAVVDALEAAHASGIVHRDLKPDNIYLTNDGGVKVLDFGIAKWTRGTASLEDELTLTETGSLMGTPHYMAPEQVFGERDVDARADVWALGIVAYECLAGTRPVVGDNFGQIFKAVALEPIPSLGAVVPSLPPEVTACVMTMLDKAREHRPALCDVATCFRRASDTPAIRDHRNAPRSRRMPAARLLLASLVLLGAGGGVLARVAHRDVSMPTPEVQREAPAVSTQATAPSRSSDPIPAPREVDSEAPRLEPSSMPPREPPPRKRDVPKPSTAPEALPGNVHGISPY